MKENWQSVSWRPDGAAQLTKWFRITGITVRTVEHLDLNLSDIESQDSLSQFPPPASSQAYILWRGLTLTKVNIDGELQFSNVAISILGQWILHNSKIFDHQLGTRLGNICFQKRFWEGDLHKYPVFISRNIWKHNPLLFYFTFYRLWFSAALIWFVIIYL